MKKRNAKPAVKRVRRQPKSGWQELLASPLAPFVLREDGTIELDPGVEERRLPPYGLPPGIDARGLDARLRHLSFYEREVMRRCSDALRRQAELEREAVDKDTLTDFSITRFLRDCDIAKVQRVARLVVTMIGEWTPADACALAVTVLSNAAAMTPHPARMIKGLAVRASKTVKPR